MITTKREPHPRAGGSKKFLLAALLSLGATGAGLAWAQAPAAPRAKPLAAPPHDHQAPPSAGGPGMGGGMMGGGMMGGGMCPMMAGAGDVKIDVKNTDKGVTITWTAADAAKATRLQKWAAGMKLMHEAMSP